MKTHPYKILGIGMGVIGALFAGLMIVGILLPGGWQVERETEIAAPPTEVFALVNSAAGWEAWMVGPETGFERFGPTEGVGSGHRWDDPAYGRGEFVITESSALSSLGYDVSVEDGAIRIQGSMTLRETPAGTRVLWTEVGDFGWNPLLGYLAGRMEDLQGAQLEASLALLAEAATGDSVPVRSRPE